MVLIILELTVFEEMMKADGPDLPTRIEQDHKGYTQRKLELLHFAVHLFFFVFYVAEAVLKV